MPKRLNGTTDTKYYPGALWIDKPKSFNEIWRPEGGGLFGGVQLKEGIPVPVDRMPTKAMTSRKLKKLPDFFLLNGTIGVSEACKNLIEELEPSVHQFIPVEIIRKDGVEFPGKCYVLNVLTMFDSAAIPEKSTIKRYVSPNRYKDFPKEIAEKAWYYTFTGNPDPNKFNQVYLDSNIVGNHHLWRDRRLFSLGITGSDEFVKRFQDAGMGYLDTGVTEIYLYP